MRERGVEDTHSRNTFGAKRVWMLYPSLCLVSPAMTEKSSPAMARIVPPFSEYGLNRRSVAIELSTRNMEGRSKVVQREAEAEAGQSRCCFASPRSPLLIGIRFGGRGNRI